MRNRSTDEEYSFQCAWALRSQFAGDSSHSREVSDATSRQVQFQLPEWRALTESEADTMCNLKVFA